MTIYRHNLEFLNRWPPANPRSSTRCREPRRRPAMPISAHPLDDGAAGGASDLTTARGAQVLRRAANGRGAGARGEGRSGTPGRTRDRAAATPGRGTRTRRGPAARRPDARAGLCARRRRGRRGTAARPPAAAAGPATRSPGPAPGRFRGAAPRTARAASSSRASRCSSLRWAAGKCASRPVQSRAN